MEIVHLRRSEWKGAILPIGYAADRYYDAAAERTPEGFAFRFVLRPADPVLIHTPAEHDFPDRLYADDWPLAWAWGVVEDGRLRAAIETCPEQWSNRLRVTELWVAEDLRRRGLGHALMDLAREQARLERRRAVVLETQSCNAEAIAFYLREGFVPVGCDLCAYGNDDAGRREVRVEMGLLRARPAPCAGQALTIRPERPEDFPESEAMVRRAFWNKFAPGCNEHLLVRKLRADPVFVPELSRVAVLDGRIAGGIWYAWAALEREGWTRRVLTFGPLAADPAQQGRGIGAALLRATLPAAAQTGAPGIVIFGEPDYYPRFGFRPGEQFGITTADGRNFPAFQALELVPGALSEFGGAFREPPVYENLPAAEQAAPEDGLPPLEKHRFPCQFGAREKE